MHVEFLASHDCRIEAGVGDTVALIELAQRPCGGDYPDSSAFLAACNAVRVQVPHLRRGYVDLSDTEWSSSSCLWILRAELYRKPLAIVKTEWRY